MSERAFDAALRVFNKTRTGMVGCLRAAIEAYKAEELYLLHVDHAQIGLAFHVADTETGPETALVITGFKDLAAIECFVAEKLHASGK